MAKIIVNGIEQSRLREVRLYVSIMKGQYQRNLTDNIAEHIINFMRSVYLSEHPFDEIEMTERRLIVAEHVVNYIYLSSEDVKRRVALAIDFDNMLSLSRLNYGRYLTDSLCQTLTSNQSKFLTDKYDLISTRYNYKSERLLAPPSEPLEKKRLIAKRGVKRSVAQIDRDGNLVAVFPSTKSAADAVGISAKAITNNLRGWAKSSGGFVWKYLDEI